MTNSGNTDLLIALAICALAIGVFGWTVVSGTRRVGLVMSEGRAPRRYVVLGLAIGLGLIYVMRR